MSLDRFDGVAALVTGANRGLGRALAEALLERGVATLYAGARRPETLDELAAAHPDRVRPLRLDVTNDDEVQQASAAVESLDLLVNNAGIVEPRRVVNPRALEAMRRELEVNVLGSLRMIQAFAPTLVDGGGTLVSIGSISALVSFPLFPTYAATKAALHSLTQAARMALGPEGVAVHGVYPGPVATDMAEGIPFETTPAPEVAEAILDGVLAGEEEIFPDPVARSIGSLYRDDPKALEARVVEMVQGS